jgi:hypothetical protein
MVGRLKMIVVKEGHERESLFGVYFPKIRAIRESI